MLRRELLQYSGQKLLPAYKPEIADEMPFNFAANTRYKMGLVVGQVTNSANDVQTITITGGPTSGNATVLVRDPRSGSWDLATIPYNATASSVLSVLTGILGVGNVTTGGGPLPGTPITVTAAGAFVGMPLNLFSVEANTFAGGTNPAMTIAHTTIGRTLATVAPYNDANSDGTQTAKGVCAFEVATDSGGNIFYGPAAVEGYAGEVFPDANIYIRGYFHTSKLIGLDNNAIADMGRLVSGTLANGIILLGG